MNKTTEKAIKAWLALPKEERVHSIATDRGKPTIYLLAGNDNTLIAQFTIASIVAKRYPRRKKKGKK